MTLDTIPQQRNFANIQKAFEESLDKKIWVCSDKDKKPINPVTGQLAKSNDPTSWGTFSEVTNFIKKNPDYRPALAISETLGITVIDLDDVCDPITHTPLKEAQDIINKMSSYTEISSSGRGLHIFVKAKKPGDKCRKAQIEIYDRNKFMTVTGNVLPGYEEIKNNQDSLQAFYNDVFKEDAAITIPIERSPSLSDEDVLNACRRAKNADKFKTLYDKGKHDGDASAADMSLCSILAFYTQDEQQIERLLKTSALKRAKWDSHKTYLSITIQNALKGLKSTYQPQIESAGEASWEKPSKITQDINLDIEFPLKELPDVLKNAVEEVSRDSRVDPALVSLPGLGMISLVVGKKAIVVEKSGLKHHCSLLLVGVAASGERKSSCFDSMLDGVKAEIENEMEDYHKAKASVRAHNELIREAVAEIKKSLKDKKTSPQEAQQQIEELYANEKQAPPEPHNFGDDLTEERLFQKIADHNGAYGIFSSDGRGIIKKILGKKTGESGDSIYISAMWGDDLSRSRVGNNKGEVGGEDLRIRKPALTTVAFIQPDLWDELSKDKRMRESGFISRITLVIPISQMGSRLESCDDPPLDATKIKPFTEAVLRLRKWKPKATIEIHLDKEAAEMRREFFNSIERELGAGGSLEDVKDIATKATTMATRLALNIAMLEAADNPAFNGHVHSITKEQWLRAQALEEYFLAQAIDSQRTHGKTGMGHILQKIAAWLKKQALQHKDKDIPLTFLASQIAKGNRGTKTTDIEEKIIPAFIEKGWLRSCGTARGGKHKYELNQRVIDENL